MSPRKHVLFVSVPLLGHITPLLQLARKVAQSQTVSFVVSDFRLTHMRSRGIIAPDDEKIISFYGILDGMGEKMDNIIFNPGNANENDVKKFFEPVEIFLSSFPTRAIETKETAAIIDDSPDSPIKVPVDVVIVDYALCRNDSIFQRSVPIIGFISSPAFVFANKLAVNESTPELPNDAFFSPWEHIVGGPIPKFCKAQVAHYNKVLPLFKAFVFNSVAEMEPSSTTLLRKSPLTSGTPALFVGPLFLIADTNAEENSLQSTVAAWLDGQEIHSVIYVSFGSLAVAVEAQVVEISKALISLNKPFIWSLSVPQQKYLPAELSETLSHGKVLAPNFLILPWAPQRPILAHKATGVFVSHCGWNSTLESMIHGVPIVGWPMFGDQYGNAVMVEKRGAGVIIPGTSMLFTEITKAEAITGAVNEVLTEAGSFRKRAEETGRVISEAASAGGSSHNDLKKVVQLSFLQS